MAEHPKPELEEISDAEVEAVVGGVVLDCGSGMLTSKTLKLDAALKKRGDIIIKGKDIL